MNLMKTISSVIIATLALSTSVNAQEQKASSQQVAQQLAIENMKQSRVIIDNLRNEIADYREIQHKSKMIQGSIQTVLPYEEALQYFAGASLTVLTTGWVVNRYAPQSKIGALLNAANVVNKAKAPTLTAVPVAILAGVATDVTISWTEYEWNKMNDRVSDAQKLVEVELKNLALHADAAGAKFTGTTYVIEGAPNLQAIGASPRLEIEAN